MKLELETAEPDLNDAKAALSSNKPQLLLYATPPVKIKEVLSAVLVLRGETKEKATKWDNIKIYMLKEGFIPSI